MDGPLQRLLSGVEGMWWIDAGAAATLLVGLSAAISTVVSGAWSRRAHREAVRAALKAEVAALAQLIRARGYIQAFEDSAAYVAETGKEHGFVIPVPQHYCLVYTSNVGSIGALPASIAGEVVRFYQLVMSVAEDVSPNGAIGQGCSDPNAFLEAKEMLTEALQIADSIK